MPKETNRPTYTPTQNPRAFNRKARRAAWRWEKRQKKNGVKWQDSMNSIPEVWPIVATPDGKYKRLG